MIEIRATGKGPICSSWRPCPTRSKIRRPRHVSGEELLSGIRELLLNRFGPMTVTVLEHWGIRSTEDFGNVVFNLVDNRVLSKTEEDDIGQFRNGYDFTEVFPPWVPQAAA